MLPRAKPNLSLVPHTTIDRLPLSYSFGGFSDENVFVTPIEEQKRAPEAFTRRASRYQNNVNLVRMMEGSTKTRNAQFGGVCNRMSRRTECRRIERSHQGSIRRSPGDEETIKVLYDR